MSRAGTGQSGSFALDLAKFAEQAKEAVDISLRDIIIEIGSSVIRMSPVGKPEIWAANMAFRDANTRAADDYDFKVSLRNTVINLTESNFTKSGKLKRGVKYAKPLTKAERDQNFNVNGLVAGQGYVGGRFRGNWMFGIGAPNNTITEEVDPSGSKSNARIANGVLEFRAGDVAYITNSLPYAIPLEFGHSTQAPNGMVRVTLTKFQKTVEDAIRKHQV
ncbi:MULTISPECIES: hypothetical protein [Pseudomonas syringae group]|uniref:Prophage PssSM-02 n=3 Tax=root TaxID=1 RepID=A0AAW4DPB5_PSESX|nr:MULTISPECIES: hypothetical protein [Pseudomonas syringae group]YP_010772952.1 hypothetical protein QIT78_gp22 [Pseudomonas phage Medea1]KGK92237.1 prophage PssSM-02 [Pseudomonas syringae pv. tomato]KUR47628.1 hypothetical protein PSTA9_01481 [Pseudomonas syringae pv. tomato]KUR48033.1 hypothetical protein PST407_02292 [Pseudomonas syringae pv. tomato]MBI6711622.1 hypothetical protein [Pseudomonas syringae]MBI6735931.1 hypothetical protein [Pseudomonas syringae]